MSPDDSVNEVAESILEEQRLERSLRSDSREDVQKWVCRVDRESRRFAEQMAELDTKEDRDEYYRTANKLCDRLAELRESDVIAFLEPGVISELDELIDQLDSVGGKPGGVVLDLEPDPTQRNASSQSNDDNELVQIQREREQEMLELVEGVKGIREAIRERGFGDL
jgi:hypothetical protein